MDTERNITRTSYLQGYAASQSLDESLVQKNTAHKCILCEKDIIDVYDKCNQQIVTKVVWSNTLTIHSNVYFINSIDNILNNSIHKCKLHRIQSLHSHRYIDWAIPGPAAAGPALWKVRKGDLPSSDDEDIGSDTGWPTTLSSLIAARADRCTLVSSVHICNMKYKINEYQSIP